MRRTTRSRAALLLKLAALTFALPMLPPGALAEPPPGRLLASQCAQCHGTDGRSVGGIESLAGKGSRELLEKMLEMKSLTVPEEIMHRQARGYTDEQLGLIADYFSLLPEHGDD